MLTAVSLMAAAACAGTQSGPETGVKPNEIGGSSAPKAPRSCRRQGDVQALTPLAKDGGTVVLAEGDGRTLALVADSDERAVHVVDVDGQTLSTTQLDGAPSQLAVLDDGRVVVALRDRSKLLVLEPKAKLAEPMVERCRADTPVEPVALTLSPDGKALYAVSGWGAKLVGYDTEELRPTVTVDVPRDPREVLLSGDGKQAYVAHAVGGKTSVVDLDAKSARPVSTTERTEHDLKQIREKIRKIAKRPDGPLDEDQIQEAGKVLADFEEKIADEKFSRRRTSCQSFALARSSNERVFVPQVLVDRGDLHNRPSGYGDDHVTTEVPSVAVIDGKTGFAMMSSLQVNNTIAFRNPNDEIEHCILPRSAAVDDDSSSLLVGCFGTDVVVAYDALSPDPARVEKRRWRVAAGPSGIAVDATDHRAVVWSQFDRKLNVIRLAAADDDVRKIAIPSDPERQLSVEQLLGRALFHSTNDSRIAKDGRACASCHPDGREDGLVWATPNGPRRTKLLAGGLHGTAPFAWDGGAAKLENHLEDTFDRLRGAGGLRSVELRSLMTYLKSLPAPPEVAPEKPQLVARGKEIFESKQAGCSSCHVGETLSDNKIHDVKSKTQTDRKASFDTPSLRFLRGRAPYYHDGRFQTLGELLEKIDGDMGHTKHLSDTDKKALQAFLMTL
jgi:DNA-binding beta-propeller fold protein YncE